MKTRERPAVGNVQHATSYADSNIANLNRVNMTKWSIKEKLYLISCVLINGDSNWSRICNQLNKWMKFTTSYYGQPTAETLRTNNVLTHLFYSFPFLCEHIRMIITLLCFLIFAAMLQAVQVSG